MKRMDLFTLVVEFITAVELPVTNFTIGRVGAISVTTTPVVFTFAVPEFDYVQYSRHTTIGEIIHWVSVVTQDNEAVKPIRDNIMEPMGHRLIKRIIRAMISRDEVKLVDVDNIFNEIPKAIARPMCEDIIYNIVMHPKTYYKWLLEVSRVLNRGTYGALGNNEPHKVHGIELTTDENFIEDVAYIFTVPNTYRIEQPELLPPTIRKVIGADNEYS